MPLVLWWANVIGEAVRLQLSRGFTAQVLSGAVLSPLAASIYILMAVHAGRADLTGYVLMAPILGGLWGTAITTSGDAIATERSEGTLELLVAAPAPAALVAVGRVIGGTIQSLISIPVTLILATAMGVRIAIAEPLLLVLAVFALAFSSVAVGLIFAGLFVLARSASLFTTVINWPLWILGGIAFPVTLLPAFIQPLSAVVALSWVGSVLRGAATGAGQDWWTALAIGLGLGVAYFLIASRLFVHVERRVRVEGSLSSF